LTDTTGETTNYLIAKKVGSIQYLLAQQHHITVILTDWINSCWTKQCLVPHKEFILPPFSGCVISVTGLTASTRNEIQRLAKAYGGEYTPNLTKRCTHLLSKVPQGIKYRYALEWGIHCVSIHWFFDSINLQVCADETRYFFTYV
jgi:topoisomerase (DNA) II binding protein 1